MAHEILSDAASGFDRAPGLPTEVLVSVVYNALRLIDVFAGFRNVVADFFE
jgi:hypothetical protein